MKKWMFLVMIFVFGIQNVGHAQTPTKTMIAIGANHLLKLDEDGMVWSKGDNLSGQLGLGNTKSTSVFKPIKSLSKIVAIGANGERSMALDEKGNVFAWGFNGYGENGSEQVMKMTKPSLIQTPEKITEFSVGQIHTLLLGQSGMVYTLGNNAFGQLGNGTTDWETHSKPLAVNDLPPVSKVYANKDFSFALTKNGDVYAWGINYHGQLGNGNAKTQTKPVKIESLTDINSIHLGTAHGLALTNDGEVYGWGSNFYGQSVETKNLFPQKIDSLTNISSLATTSKYSMAITTNGDLFEWGMKRSREKDFISIPKPTIFSQNNKLTKLFSGEDFIGKRNEEVVELMNLDNVNKSNDTILIKGKMIFEKIK